MCCLEDFDPGVKEAAAWALGYIARHNERNTGQSVVEYINIVLFCADTQLDYVTIV